MKQSHKLAVTPTPVRANAQFDCAAIAAIVATAFLYNRWLLDARTYFFFDDWQWLWRAEFFPWSDTYFSLLPSWAYNDRPVGATFIKVLYGLFQLNHRAFQFALLSLHAINCALLFAIAVRYIGRAGAVIAALLAATWFASNDAVGWTAAIFDLLGATLCATTSLVRPVSARRRNDGGAAGASRTPHTRISRRGRIRRTTR